MRKIAQVDRDFVKSFIQKDSTITCPRNGEYYALLDDGGEILSALCVTDHRADAGCYMIQSMRTARINRKKGYSTALVKYVIASPAYKDAPIRAHALNLSKDIFSRCGFRLISVEMVRNHLEWFVEKTHNIGQNEDERMMSNYGKTEDRD